MKKNLQKNLKIGLLFSTGLIALLTLAFVIPNMIAEQLPSTSGPKLTGFISDVGAVQDVVVSPDGTKAYLASNPFGLVTLDISNIQSPKVIGSQRPSVGPAGHLAISPGDGTIAVVTGTPRGTDIVDISNPTSPKVLASVAGTSVDAAISGNYAYIVALGDVKVVDITNPASPQVVTTLVTPGIASGIAISGTTAVVTDTLSGNIRIVDISSQTSPSIVGSVSLGGLSGKVAITTINNIKYGLVANTSLGQLQIVDINTPSNPQVKGSISTGSALDVTAVGSTAYVSANANGLAIVDISTPNAPRILSNKGVTARAVGVSGNIALLAQDSLGIEVLNISNPIAPTTITTLKNQSASTHLAISADGKTAVVAGTSRGTDIVDISNSEYPKILTSMAGTSVDAAISGKYAYIVTAGDVKVVDLTNPASPQVVATLVTPRIASGIAISGALGAYQNTALVSDCLYGDVIVVDISNPISPAILGSVSLGGLSGKVAITEISGKKYGLVANTSLGKLQIVDISTPSNPQVKGSISTGSALDVTAVGSTAYVSANGTFKIVNIANPVLPQLLSTYTASAQATSILGNTAYLAQGSAGLDTVDISNPSSPQKLAHIQSLGEAKDVVVANNKLYVASGTAEIEIYSLGTEEIPSYLNGKVTTEASQPVAGATVTAYKFSNNNFVGAFHKVAETITDSSGLYNFQEVLPTGAYTIIAAPAGTEMKLVWEDSYGKTYVPSSTSTYAHKSFKITEGVKYTQNLTVRPAERYTNTIHVYQSQTNEMLSDARVLLQDASTGQIVYDKTTNEVGEFSVYPEDNVPDGDYYSAISKNGYTGILADNKSSLFNSQINQIKIPTYLESLSPRLIGSLSVFANSDSSGILKGTVKNDSGNPVGNVAMILRHKENSQTYCTKTALVTGTSQSTGAFNFASLYFMPTNLSCISLPGGDYFLEVIPGPGYNSTIIDPVNISKDQPPELSIILTSSSQGASESLPQAPSGTASLEETASPESTPHAVDQSTQISTISVISGTLTDEKTKQPIASANVSIVDKNNKVISESVTNKEGKYELYYEPEDGKVTFKATKDNYSYTKRNVDLGQNKDQTISPEIKKSNWFASWIRKAVSSISDFFKKIF